MADFVRTLWENTREGYDEKLTPDTAALVLGWMRADGDVPEDLTPEDFMEQWNELVDWQKGADA